MGNASENKTDGGGQHGSVAADARGLPPIDLGGVLIELPVILAPMSGVTEPSSRP